MTFYNQLSQALGYSGTIFNRPPNGTLLLRRLQSAVNAISVIAGTSVGPSIQDALASISQKRKGLLVSLEQRAPDLIGKLCEYEEGTEERLAFLSGTISGGQVYGQLSESLKSEFVDMMKTDRMHAALTNATRQIGARGWGKTLAQSSEGDRLVFLRDGLMNANPLVRVRAASIIVETQQHDLFAGVLDLWDTLPSTFQSELVPIIGRMHSAESDRFLLLTFEQLISRAEFANEDIPFGDTVWHSAPKPTNHWVALRLLRVLRVTLREAGSSLKPAIIKNLRVKPISPAAAGLIEILVFIEMDRVVTNPPASGIFAEAYDPDVVTLLRELENDSKNPISVIKKARWGLHALIGVPKTNGN